MASSSKRDKERDVDTLPAESSSDAVTETPVAKEFVVPDVETPDPTPLVETMAMSKAVSAKVQATIDSAAKGWTIKVKSKVDFDAVSAALKSSNPKNLKVVHKPGLGHHSVAVG